MPVYMLHFMLYFLSLASKLVLKHVHVIFYTLFSFTHFKTNSEAYIIWFVCFPLFKTSSEVYLLGPNSFFEMELPLHPANGASIGKRFPFQKKNLVRPLGACQVDFNYSFP